MLSHRFFYCIALLIFFTTVKAQDAKNGIIKGKLVDQNKISIPFASLILKKDSILYKAGTSDAQGTFKFNALTAGNYIVQAQMLGYDTLIKSNIHIDQATHTIDLGTLQLLPSTKLLKAVNITAQRPVIERRADRLVINLNSNIRETSIMDVMNRLPGVLVSPDDQISLGGKGVQIYIDGKPTKLPPQALTGLLKGMPPASIDKIELIEHPSAKYDGAGNGGIINIIRKRDSKIGLNGNLYGGMEQGKNGKQNGGINLNYKTAKYNLLLSGDYSYSKFFSNSSLVTDVFNPDYSLQSKESAQINSTRQSRSFTPNLGLDLYLSKKTTLSLSINTTGQQAWRRGNSYSERLDNAGQEINNVLFINPVSTHSSNFSSGAHLRHQIDSTGREYTIDMDYLNNNTSSSQNNKNIIRDSTGSTQNSLTLLNQGRKLDVYSIKGDYSLPLKSKASFETGFKSSYTKVDNSNEFFDASGNIPVPLSSKDDFFKYTENINALYGTYAKVYKKFSYHVGLRAEGTLGKGEQVQNNRTFTRNYLQLFPSAFFDYKFGAGNGLNLSLTKKTQRPTYEDLNPLIRIVNSNNYLQGNPALKPVNIYNANITYSYKNSLSATLGYSVNFNDFTYLTSSYNNSEITTTQPENNRYTKSYNFSVYYYKQLNSWWFTSSNLNVNRQAFKSTVDNDILNTSGIFTFSFNTYDSFTISKKISFLTLFRFQGKSVVRNIVYDPYYFLIAGIQDKIFGKRGSVSMNVTDILGSYKNSYIQNSGTIKQYWNNRFETRLFRLNFIYSFGGDIHKTKTSTGADEEKQRSAKDDYKNPN